MSEPNPETGCGESEIDDFLRSSMLAPIPTLPPDFDRQVMRRVHRGSRSVDRYGRTMLIGYAVISVLTCVVIMRGQGLDWSVILLTILGSLALVVPARTEWRRKSLTLKNNQRYTC